MDTRETVKNGICSPLEFLAKAEGQGTFTMRTRLNYACCYPSDLPRQLQLSKHIPGAGDFNRYRSCSQQPGAGAFFSLQVKCCEL